MCAGVLFIEKKEKKNKNEPENLSKINKSYRPFETSKYRIVTSYSALYLHNNNNNDDNNI